MKIYDESINSKKKRMRYPTNIIIKYLAFFKYICIIHLYKDMFDDDDVTVLCVCYYVFVYTKHTAGY